MKRFLRPASLSCALLLAVGASAPAVELPSMGDPSQKTLSPAEDVRLGEAFMRSLRQHVRLIDDPELTAYIEDLGFRLVAHSDAVGAPFHFFIVDHPAINAFAAPGGYIGVHSGLILAAQSEDELAAVLAHEIAHVTQRHLARTLESANRLTLPTAAAILAALVLGSQSGQAAQAALATATAGAAQMQINFTRANEYEADRVGIHTLARAGFEPTAMARFFQRLNESTRFYSQDLPELLRTHPVNDTRIAEAQDRARAVQNETQEAVNGSAAQFGLMHSKLAVSAAADPLRAVEKYRAEMQQNKTPDAAVRYGYLLALLNAGRADPAAEQLALLRREDRDRVSYVIADARIAEERNQPTAALAALREGLKIFPNNRALTLHYAQALLRNKAADEAQRLLTTQLQQTDRGHDPALFGLLAQAAGATGDTADAHEYLALHYYQSGETRAAIEQLELALKAPAMDEYQATRLRARLATYRREFREEQQRL